MTVWIPGRLLRRCSIVLSVSVLVGLTALPARSAAPAAQECRGTLILESFTIVNDTDPNPPWERADSWTYHTYGTAKNDAKGIRVFERHKDYLVQGDSGYFEQVNAKLHDSVLLGAPGDTVSLKLGHWTKEEDPRGGTRGVYPADRNRMTMTQKATCQPSEFHFSVFNPVYANPAPGGPDEHDGLWEFRWTWILEVV